MIIPANRILATNLGFPRIGSHRELKTALESYWSGASNAEELARTAASLRARHWVLQQKAGIDHIPSNDFSFYDQMLDTIAMLGAVPHALRPQGRTSVDLDLYFAMARGAAGCAGDGDDQMVRHQLSLHRAGIVRRHRPSRSPPTRRLTNIKEAKFLGIDTRPVLIGPVTFLKLAKMRDGSDRWRCCRRFLPHLSPSPDALAEAGAEWVQMDEPVLVSDLDDAARDRLARRL